MLFNSVSFMLFFPAAALLYYLVPKKIQVLYLLAASYFVYLWWEPVYGLLLFFSTLLTYGCGLLLERAQRGRRAILAGAILADLAPLFFFKYYNFFAQSLASALGLFGVVFEPKKLSLLVPLGISFYTFQTIGYTIDVYRKKVPAERRFLAYSLFVSFFPQVASGPIGRADALMPQFCHPHAFCYDTVTDGLRQMALGFFKKIAVADMLAIFVDGVFGDLGAYSGLTLIFAVFCYLFQIYCDFAGYSDIAIGCAKVLGFDLMDNFQTPLLSTSITAFWGRWHISLSSWFKDYLYIPLGGSHCTKVRHLCNLALIFLVSGLWHGAAWTYVVWGALHALFRVLEELYKMAAGRRFGEGGGVLSRVFHTVLTACLVAFSFIFFRAPTLGDAVYVVRTQFKGLSLSRLGSDIFALAQKGFNATPALAAGFIAFCALCLALLILLDCYRCFALKNKSLAHDMAAWRTPLRWGVYYLLTGLIFGAFLMQNGGFGASASFIYLQY